MRLTQNQIKELQKLLKEQTGKDYTDEDAQEAGIAIIRFVIAKETRKMATGQKTKDNNIK
jgi:hypothetical protein